MDQSYQNAAIFFRRNPDVKQTILTYFGDNLPQNAEIPFIFIFNTKAYVVMIKGNIERYLQDTEFMTEED
jgi:hypothetical protein